MSAARLEGNPVPDQHGSPYLSVVATARNDDHGGRLLDRMQVFVDAWVAQARRHAIECELILVEWNPPEQRPKLPSVLRWPEDSGPCRIRIIEVPPELHARYRHAAALPLYQMIAKNAGIRRARGQFILVTNIDVVFSDEVAAFLARHSLEKGKMYRIDRHDVTTGVPVQATLDEQLEYCRTHLIRVSVREGTFTLTPDGLRRNQESDVTGEGSGIHFGAGWHPVERYGEGQPFRWIDNDAEVIARVPAGGGLLLFEVEPGPGIPEKPQKLQVADEGGAVVAEWEVSERETLELLVPPGKHGLRRFRLSMPGAGVPVLDDPRMLNLRVFGCDWAAGETTPTPPASASRVLLTNRRFLARLLANRPKTRKTPGTPATALELMRSAVRLLASAQGDIFEPGIECRPEGGFFDFEESGGERFRWVDREARFCFRTGHGNGVEFLVESGPSLGFQPFELSARWNESAEAVRIPIQGLTLVRLPVPAGPGTFVRLSLAAEDGGARASEDPRNLSFRIFAFGNANTPEAAERAPFAGPWCSRTVASRPPQLDWSGQSEEDRKMIAAMGRPRFLHLNACGDFTLMAREHWHELRGYAELDQFSMHLDSLLCYAAHHMGFREEVLPESMRIYHIEHGAGSGWTPEGQDEMYLRIARKGIPTVSYPDLVRSIAQMRILHAPLIFNMDHWGLAGAELPETVLSRAGSAAQAGR